MSKTISSGELGGSTTDRLASMVHETVDRMTPRANRAEDEVRGAASKAVDSAKLFQERAVEATGTVRSYAETNPLTTAAIAFAAGVLLSALVRR